LKLINKIIVWYRFKKIEKQIKKQEKYIY